MMGFENIDEGYQSIFLSLVFLVDTHLTNIVVI